LLILDKKVGLFRMGNIYSTKPGFRKVGVKVPYLLYERGFLQQMRHSYSKYGMKKPPEGGYLVLSVINLY
jgi:hypothetical protein